MKLVDYSLDRDNMLIQMLIRRGANLEIKNKNGENVLFKSRFRINTFKLIINEGADIEC